MSPMSQDLDICWLPKINKIIYSDVLAIYVAKSQVVDVLGFAGQSLIV